MPPRTAARCEQHIVEMGYMPVFYPWSSRWLGIATPNHNADPREIVFIAGRLKQYMAQQIREGRWADQRLVRVDEEVGSVNVPERARAAA